MITVVFIKATLGSASFNFSCTQPEETSICGFFYSICGNGKALFYMAAESDVRGTNIRKMSPWRMLLYTTFCPILPIFKNASRPFSET
jgi:hypothetical protein